MNAVPINWPLILSDELFRLMCISLSNGLYRVIGQIQIFMSYYNLQKKKEIGQIIENILNVENAVYVIVVN